MFETIILLITGVATGFLNVMAGGGSMLSLPIMIFLGIPATIANGTNRLAILTQNISAVTTFYKKGFADFKLSFTLALCTIPGAVAGALLASKLPSENFKHLLAITMLFVILLMWFDNNKKTPINKQKTTQTRLICGHIGMLLAGFWGGFIQIGIGFILMPILHRVMGIDLLRTNMHKVFIVLAYTLVALFIFSSQLQLAWKAGISLAIGTAIGGWLAAHFQIKQGVEAIKWVLNIVLIVFIIKLLFF